MKYPNMLRSRGMRLGQEHLAGATDAERHDALLDARNTRAARLSRVLLVGLLLVGVFWAGNTYASSSDQRGPSAGGPPAMEERSAAGPAGAMGSTGQGTAASAGRSTTAGTVKIVEGPDVWVESADGTVTKVTTTDDSTVRRTESIATSELRPGETVTVAGIKTDDGTVAATLVSAGQGTAQR